MHGRKGKCHQNLRVYRNRFEYSSVAGLEKGQETESEYDITELQIIH